jgi:hypothetical protein
MVAYNDQRRTSLLLLPVVIALRFWLLHVSERPKTEIEMLQVAWVIYNIAIAGADSFNAKKISIHRSRRFSSWNKNRCDRHCLIIIAPLPVPVLPVVVPVLVTLPVVLLLRYAM